MKEVYIAIDGDDIGSKIEYLMLTDRLNLLTDFSEMFEASFRWLQSALVNDLGARIIFRGGDNLLAKAEGFTEIHARLESLMTRFQEQSGCSLSIGLGASTIEAYLALKLAKVSGKSRIYRYGMERET